ncbi:MAG TPA: isopentenyl-diphosphate Delta-isomerase [Nitrospira sp.]|nr:isopentenyl-diphosphate Delta-isomerase [Nitrospira sp.]
MTREPEEVVLLDDMWNEVGVCEKLEAHRKGLRHKAVSVFVKNHANQLLMQKRAEGKYHSPGLWSNACCTHQRRGEDAEAAARRRLREEMGFACALVAHGRHAYCKPVGGDLIENEVVDLFFGTYGGEVAPDPNEVSNFCWIAVPELKRDLERRPERYSAWLRDYFRSFGDAIEVWAA